MNGVHVAFPTAMAAFRFVSELRRQNDTLLWDVTVRPRNDGAHVVVPEDEWRSSFMNSVAASYGGAVRGGPVIEPSDAPGGR
jgi:hypothetical protein